MKFFALLLLLISCNAQAISSEYQLLDITDCTSYNVTSDAPVFYTGDNATYKMALAERREYINKLKVNHDSSWYSNDENYEGWAVYTKDKKRHIGLCKEELIDVIGNPRSFQCDGNSEFPLQELSCKVDQGNRWYEKCTAKGKANHDLRLYWVDTTEGSPHNINSGYNKDLAKFKSKCRSNQ